MRSGGSLKPVRDRWCEIKLINVASIAGGVLPASGFLIRLGVHKASTLLSPASPGPVLAGRRPCRTRASRSPPHSMNGILRSSASLIFAGDRLGRSLQLGPCSGGQEPADHVLAIGGLPVGDRQHDHLEPAASTRELARRRLVSGSDEALKRDHMAAARGSSPGGARRCRRPYR